MKNNNNNIYNGIKANNNTIQKAAAMLFIKARAMGTEIFPTV
jgi:hypothetical protein